MSSATTKSKRREQSLVSVQFPGDRRLILADSVLRISAAWISQTFDE